MNDYWKNDLKLTIYQGLADGSQGRGWKKTYTTSKKSIDLAINRCILSFLHIYQIHQEFTEAIIFKLLTMYLKALETIYFHYEGTIDFFNSEQINKILKKTIQETMLEFMNKEINEWPESPSMWIEYLDKTIDETIPALVYIVESCTDINFKHKKYFTLKILNEMRNFIKKYIKTIAETDKGLLPLILK